MNGFAAAPRKAASPKQTGLKDSCQEIYRTAVAGISHRGSQWLFPGIYHQHTNEERQNCPGRETSSSRWPCGRAAASAGLSFPQLSTATKTSQENTLQKRSWEPSWWEMRPFKSNTEQPTPRPRRRSQSSAGNHIQARAHFFLDVLSFPSPRQPFLIYTVQEDTTTGQRCHLLFVSHTLTLFLPLFWLLEIYSTWCCIFQSPRMTWFNH